MRMSGWWSAASASGAMRLTNAIASGKPAKVNCLRIVSPSSVQPVRPVMRCSTSLRESFTSDLQSRGRSADSPLHRRTPRAAVVQPDPRGFYRLERFLLQLDRGGALGRARERAAGDGAMVGALCRL